MFWRYLQAFEYEKCASRNSTTFVISDVSASPVDQFAVALSGIFIGAKIRLKLLLECRPQLFGT